MFLAIKTHILAKYLHVKGGKAREDVSVCEGGRRGDIAKQVKIVKHVGMLFFKKKPKTHRINNTIKSTA